MYNLANKFKINLINKKREDYFSSSFSSFLVVEVFSFSRSMSLAAVFLLDPFLKRPFSTAHLLIVSMMSFEVSSVSSS